MLARIGIMCAYFAEPNAIAALAITWNIFGH